MPNGDNSFRAGSFTLEGWINARDANGGAIIALPPGRDALVVKTLEDAPFYARSLVSTAIAGEAITCVHESLSLTRFSSPVIRALLPFRMPRFG